MQMVNVKKSPKYKLIFFKAKYIKINIIINVKGIINVNFS